MLERRLGPRRLLFIGSGQSIYLDAIVRDGWEDQVTKAGIETLEQIGFWEFADLQQLRPKATAWNMVRDWMGTKTHIWQASCPFIKA